MSIFCSLRRVAAGAAAVSGGIALMVLGATDGVAADKVLNSVTFFSWTIPITRWR